MLPIRSSKFRHVYGCSARKENCYEGMKITKDAHDSNFCCVNPKFVAIVLESAGGGVFLVLPLEHIGRVSPCPWKVSGHRAPVTDIKWNPFDDNIIASGSEDSTVKVWRVPDGCLTGNCTEWLVDLRGHAKKINYIEWHPTAGNIIISAGADFKCILWNVETAQLVRSIAVHSDTIFSLSWNRDGSLLATTCKDKKIRVIEPRQGTVVAQGSGHVGPKASKVVFLDKNRLFTTGFSRMSERQYAIWDVDNLTKPLKCEVIDASSGVLLPFYDFDTKVMFLAGKGDGNIRYFEVVDDAPYVFYLSQYQSASPQRGLGVMPKHGLDTEKCEIMRFYKLHTTKDLCEPIAMIVPRKSEIFQQDIYPPTAASMCTLSAGEWLEGQNKDPILLSLHSKESGLIVQSTVRAASTPAVSSDPCSKQNGSPVTGNCQPASQQSVVRRLAADKMPASLKNIRRLSSFEDQLPTKQEWHNQRSAICAGDMKNNGILDTNGPSDNKELRKAFSNQRQELDQLRVALSSKEKRIQLLEEEVRRLRALVATPYHDIPTMS